MTPLKTLFLASLVALSSTRAGATETASSLGVPSGVQAAAVFKNAKDGLRDVMFSFDLSKVDHEYSWQFGVAFFFGDAREDVAYIAIQPGTPHIRVSFYSFTPGAESKHPEQVYEDGKWGPGCIPYADSVLGSSCHNYVEMDNYDGLFNLSVTNSGGNTWTGKYINTATGEEWKAGEWTLPHSKPIKHRVLYFLEALVGIKTCQGIPGTITTLVRPYSASTGQQAEFEDPDRTGTCGGAIQFETRDVDMGKELTIQGGSKRSRTMPVTEAWRPSSVQPQEVPDVSQTQKEIEESQHEEPKNQPSQRPAPGPVHQGPQGRKSPTGEQSVPWKTEPEHQALCRGYNGDDQACISGYEKCRQDLSGYAVVGWYDLVRCVNRLEKGP